MYPLIPHRSLLGLVRCEPEGICPGDLIALDPGAGRLVIRRVVLRDNRSDRLCCLADSNGRAAWYKAQFYAGTVVWRSQMGNKRQLVMRDRPRMRRAFIGLCRLAVRGVFAARLTAVPRRLVARLLYPPEQSSASTEEIAYLLRSVAAAVLRGPVRPEAPPPDCDWDVCLDLAQLHRVCGLLLPVWAALPPQHRPPERVLGLMNALVQSGVAAWSEGLEILACAAGALAQDGIPCLLLKGPALTEYYAGRARERAFTDLDIVVPPAQCERALAALGARGFRPAGGASRRALLRRAHFHLLLTPPAPRSMPVELHWNLVDRANLYRIDMTRIFTAASEARCDTVTVRALGTIDTLLYLCLHLRKHGALNYLAADSRVGLEWIAQGDSGNRLIWFVDLYRVLAREAAALDAVRFWRQAEEWNAADEAHEALALLQKFLPSATGSALLAAGAGNEREVSRRLPRTGLPAEGQRAFLRWAMRVHPVFLLRPVRLLELARLLFPSATLLHRYYGGASRSAWLWRRAWHPIHMLGRLLFYR
jgi:hypothetical protein